MPIKGEADSSSPTHLPVAASSAAIVDACPWRLCLLSSWPSPCDDLREDNLAASSLAVVPHGQVNGGGYISCGRECLVPEDSAVLAKANGNPGSVECCGAFAMSDARDDSLSKLSLYLWCVGPLLAAHVTSQVLPHSFARLPAVYSFLRPAAQLSTRQRSAWQHHGDLWRIHGR